MLTESSGFESDALAGMAPPQPHQVKRELNAAQVAQAYEEYVKGLWGGKPAAPAFCGWLTPYWRATLPPIPAPVPNAVSPHAAGGRGIRWYDTADGVLGYVDGIKSGYQIPLSVSVPMQTEPRGFED
jgi:hypothetical protein